jgi:hypothetical protein
MNEEQLNDLKQFIAATVSQATAGMATKEDIVNMATKEDIASMATKEDIATLRQEMRDGFSGVSEAIEQIHERIEAQEVEVDRRFTKLEQRIA